MTAPDRNRRWYLARPHDGPGMSLAREHFGRDECDAPSPGDGEILVQAAAFGCDPMNHAWAKGVPGRMPAIAVGEPLHGAVAGTVVASRHPSFAVGERVAGFLDWADYSIATDRDRLGFRLRRIPDRFGVETGLTALGMAGHCAHIGLTEIGRLAAGDTVLVTGAAGAIGTLAVQMAKLRGARVIATAGGTEKAALVRSLGADAAIDHRAAPVGARLAETCPDGIDIIFDNVGGELLDAGLLHLAAGARVVICGAIAHYAGGAALHNHIMLAIKGARMEGFFYFDHLDRLDAADADIAAWLDAGRLREILDIADGFESAPAAALGQFGGTGMGRRLVRL